MYHVNPKTGNPSQCKARKGNCPFGAVEDHFGSRLEALKHWEATNGLEVIPVAKKTIVLSDIDGTLVKSSLVLENAVELHETGVIDLGDTPARWKADMKNEELVRELAEKYREALRGKGISFVQAKKTVDRLLADQGNFYSTLQLLIDHKKNGAEVVLISGSPDFLVKPFAQRFGFKYHASSYHRNSRGKFTGEITLMAGSTAKQEVIDNLGIHSYEDVIGMGDTSSDTPLLKSAKHSILVDPTEETVLKLQEQKVKIDKIVRS